MDRCPDAIYVSAVLDEMARPSEFGAVQTAGVCGNPCLRRSTARRNPSVAEEGGLNRSFAQDGTHVAKPLLDRKRTDAGLPHRALQLRGMSNVVDRKALHVGRTLGDAQQLVLTLEAHPTCDDHVQRLAPL